MGRDQEGRQRQGLRTIFKLLEEWYRKTYESQWRLPYVWHNERSSKRKKIFNRCRNQNWLKTQPNILSDGIKELVNLYVEVEGDYAEK
jgi:hypothetical protein